MRKWMLAAGAAALAITAPALADRGDRDRGGDRRGKGNNSQIESGGGDRGQARAARSSERRQAQSARGNDNRGNRSYRFAQSERGGDRDRNRAARAQQRSDDNRQSVRASRMQERADRNRGERDRQSARAAQMQDRSDRNRAERNRADHDRQSVRAARIEDRSDRNRGNRDLRAERRDDDNRRDLRAARFEDRRDRDNRSRDSDDVRNLRFDRDDDRRFRDNDRNRFRFAEGERRYRARYYDRGVVRYRDVDRDNLFVRRLGYVNGCPPGLARKNLACLPPGQAARFVGQPLIAASRIAALDPLPVPLRSLYYDNDDYYYRYGGGYLYRVERDDDLISSIVPLFGAALLGQQLQPYYVNSHYQPSYFGSFYPNSPYDCYQYGYGYVYETDCASGLVEDVIPTYDYGYGVGQMLPASYGYYNVPYAYRSYYPDNDDYYYRYAPGAIYQVDRETSLISAVASLLTGGLTVGQQLPVGYSAYNVPYAYRTTYVDTPDMWYRYNNGYIYGVDPTTMLVTSIVDAIV